MARLSRILTLCLRGAAAVLAAALLVVAALYVWLAAQDPNGWRPELEAAVQRATGRTVAVEGAVTVGGLLPPTLSAEKITFANAAWGSEPEMARIARVEVTVDLLPLLRGRLQIATLSLAGVELLLETDGSGEGNWRFEPRPDDDADGPPPLPRRIEVRDAVIAWQDGASGMRIGGRIDRLSLAAASPEAPAQLRLEGLMNERPLRLTGAVGPLVSLFRGQDLTFDLEADTADAHARLAGRLSGRSDAMPVALDVQAAVERLDVLEPWLGRGLARDLPARATAELHFARGVVHVDRFDVTAGDSRAEGRLVVRLDGSRPHAAGEVAAVRLDLDQLLAETGDGRAAGRLLPRSPLPVRFLTRFDGTIELAAGEIRLGGVDLDTVATTLSLADGRFAAEPLRFGVYGGTANGRLHVAAGGETPRVSLQADARGLDAARLTAGGGGDLLEGRMGIRARLDGYGNSVAAVAATAEGEVRVLLANGRARTGAYDKLAGGIGPLIGTLFSGSQGWSRLNCLAGDWKVAAGVAQTRLLLIDTEHATVRGEGTVNLAKETLDLQLTPGAKSVTLNVAVPVRVTGTLADPQVTPDGASAARTIGSLLAATVYPPALLLAFGDLASGSGTPACVASVLEADRRQTGQATPVEAIGRGAAGVLEGVGRSIGDGLERVFGR